MAYHKEDNDIVIDGLEQGIASSPLFGIANIQNANISTQGGEVIASYGRIAQQQASISNGTLTASVSDGTTLLATPASLKAGTWIRVSASTITSITAATNPSSASFNYLAVGGGGGGGGSNDPSGGAGGGGAGAVRTGSSTLAVGSYQIIVGTGGQGGTIFQGDTGANSSIETIITAAGGGGGGCGSPGVSPTTAFDGKNGGSGGGGGGGDTGGPVNGVGGTGTTGGNNGGTGRGSTTTAGGGGGGANAVGANASNGAGGAGGAGIASSISGTSVTYGGGGGGGSSGTRGAAGIGGGGRGGDSSGSPNIGFGDPGTDGLGGGGGGGNWASGGDGGDGIIIISYATGSMFAIGGDVSQVGGNTIHTFRVSGTFQVISIATGGLYYVSYKDANNKIKLSTQYDPYGAHAITHGTSGTATFSTVAVPGSGIAKAVEPYTTATSKEYRYYVLDHLGYVWVYDTQVYDASLAASGVATLWMLPDPTDYSSLAVTGLAVLNGWLMQVSNKYIFGKQTVRLGLMSHPMNNVFLNEPFPTHTNRAMVGSQGKMYYCDGNYIGEVFPTTSLITTVQNVQSYSKYTAINTTRSKIDYIIGGSLPFAPGSTPPTGEYSARIPVVFFTDEYGTLPTGIIEGKVYYIRYDPSQSNFVVRNAPTGGNFVDMQTGASGNQYFNTFYPIGSEAGVGGNTPTLQWTGQRMNLPFHETAQCLVEIGNQVLVGCEGNIVYPWNQVDAIPSDLIALPEADVKTMINVNNMAYIFAGSKGNIYITNGSVASLSIKVPDYCAGVPGTPLTYIEPYFTWGDAGYIRGRVYFSILDQTAPKVGNCGGVWSFVPTENIDPSQNMGMALRLENQNSYGNYNGMASIILPNEEQQGNVSPLYWTFWQTSYSIGTSTFGIDQTGTNPVTEFIVETDLIPTGTSLEKDTLSQLEYKVANQLQTGDAVQLYYRLNATDAWTSCGSTIEEATRLSGYYKAIFQKTQWLQFRAVCNTVGTTASSFIRLTNLRFR